jgi:DNA-binding Lrp family transcriptional regulator
MKNVELRLISELMKNSKRSDKELARAIGVSQPTVSRVRGRLEKEGIIKEYTMIPDFNKLGFEIGAITFVRLLKELSDEEFKELRKSSKELTKRRRDAVLMAMNGIGLGYDRVFISFHTSYTSYAKAISDVKALPNVDASHVDSFMINLIDKTHFQPLTLLAVANHLSKTEEKKLMRN